MTNDRISGAAIYSGLIDRAKALVQDDLPPILPSYTSRSADPTAYASGYLGYVGFACTIQLLSLSVLNDLCLKQANEHAFVI